MVTDEIKRENLVVCTMVFDGEFVVMGNREGDASVLFTLSWHISPAHTPALPHLLYFSLSQHPPIPCNLR